jgi:ketosteroid isomerase-like protein
MLKKILFLLLVCISQNAIAQSKDEQEILKLLSAQVEFWNKGDVNQFMHGYWENDSLMFVGKDGVTYGYNKTLENYKKNYPDKAYMGVLKFTLLSVDPLSKDYYSVIGKWELTRSVGNVSGHYTLLFKKINGQWKIILDHSS